MLTSLPFVRRVVITGSLAAAAVFLIGAGPIQKQSGARMCVLTKGDFNALGVSVSAKPSVHVDDGGQSAYCVYRGLSGAMGGVELDVFYPAGADPSAIQQTFDNVVGSDPGTHYIDENVPGADKSIYSLTVPQQGHPDFAANAVRRRDLVFSISLPASPRAKEQLLKLSELVLRRLAN